MPRWPIFGCKIKKFSGASPLDPTGGLTAPPRPPAVLNSLRSCTRFARLTRFARFLAPLARENPGRNKDLGSPCLGRNKGSWPEYLPLICVYFHFIFINSALLRTSKNRRCPRNVNSHGNFRPIMSPVDNIIKKLLRNLEC